MLEICDVSHEFGTKGSRVQAISSISSQIAAGSFVSLIGPSGCGKSTLLKIVGALISPVRGRVTVDGVCASVARKDHAFSFVFQNPVLLPWRNVLKNVNLPLEVILQSRRSRLSPEEILDLVGLSDSMDKFPFQLSGGMQQRASIARALTYDPKILLMDEPFGALDEITRHSLNEILIRIWEETGVTILFVTHSISEALYLSDRVLVLSQRPATVAFELDVPFARSRNPSLRETSHFQDLVRTLREKL